VQSDILTCNLIFSGYNAKKIDENIEAEIMQVVLDEVHESYQCAVLELQSDTIAQLEANVRTIAEWTAKFQSENR